MLDSRSDQMSLGNTILFDFGVSLLKTKKTNVAVY